MPIYDYQCRACRDEFTVTHKISDAEPKCPNCGGEVRKKLSAPAVHGSGKKAEPGFQGHGCGAGACGCKH
jgi:putative FmdB family regulatory protein